MIDCPEAGVLLVDKPVGATSFAMVRAVRKIFGIKKVGHAGTLDPFATGLLIVCIGRPATKLISQFMDGDKEYLATLKLGARSSTQDPEGDIRPGIWDEKYSGELISSVLSGFVGEIMQTPPAFSALKHKGKPLYHYARKGVPITKEPRNVHIHSLEWEDQRSFVDSGNPYITIKVVSGKGTYIRALAADIGDNLGCGAYLTSLRRTRSGCFFVEDSLDGTAFSRPEPLETAQKYLLSVGDVQNLLQ
ncbi:MAG: tRNA pseudouridine(55) synthase TruB [Desulfocapsaceae bacterium]|jgi:tRNA pseudouridine55 synthase|nr:tRNA pseudouridine(55) synthase TruB [Desulfocapsaceae bacterium]